MIGSKWIIISGVAFVLLVGSFFLFQSPQSSKSLPQKPSSQSNLHPTPKTTATSIISFAPQSSKKMPMQKKVGDMIPLDIMINPKTHLVNRIMIVIRYDSTKLEPLANAFTADGVFPTVVGQPVYSPGKILVTLSVGSDMSKAANKKVKVGTVTFKAIAATDPGKFTRVNFGPKTKVQSVARQDNPKKNVLHHSVPATIVISPK